ncbi:MAG TPA: aldo/keto reductase [Terriglobales bacterium]|nr:aldo/keto reductase [Terriglobales bacterium]
MALAWLLAKPFVSSILLGASKVSQLEDNLAAANVQLTANELAELATLTAPVAIYPNWFQAKTHDPAASAALGKKNATT